MTTGEKLVILRGKRSREEIAALAGVSVSSLVKYERNERVPRDEVKIKLANILGKSVSYIFFG